MNHSQNFFNRFPVSRLLLFFLFLLGLFTYGQTANAGQIDEVKVGIFNNKPMCFFDDTDKPAGIFVSIVEYTAIREGWKLVYVRDSFSSLRAKLENGEIDILLSTSVSEERMKLYAYNETNVFHNWAEVYISSKTEISSLLDLKGKRIATLKNGIYTTGPEGILKLDDKFHLNCEFIFVDDYYAGLKAVNDGSADAAVANRLTGAMYGKEFDLEKSGIVFAPVKIRFALNKESSKAPILINALDHHLAILIRDENSIYHQALKRWLGGVIEVPRDYIPQWLIYAFLVTFCIILIFIFWNRTLYTQIKERKRAEEALLQSEERFKALHDASFGGIIIHDKGLILECNQGLTDLTGFTNEELVGMNGLTLIAPDWLDQVLKNIKSGYDKAYEVEGVRKDGSVYPLAIRGKNIPFKGRDARVIEFRDITERKQVEAEIKKLRGILPLCSFCKKVRDDKGYWEQVDVYIHKYSEADISHSICPKCMKENYPEEI